MLSADSHSSEPTLAPLPAPLTPDLQSAISLLLSARPASSSGKKPSCVAVG